MRSSWMLSLALAVPLLASPARAAAGATYYVDAVAGSDANSGQSESAAWQSLAKASALTLGPGDRLLFRAGQRWQGQLSVKGAGAPGSPALVGAYGTGAKPIIDGAGQVDIAIKLTNSHDLTLDGFEVTNWSNSTTARSGVNLYAKDAGRLENVTLRNLNIHDIDGPGGSHVGAAGLMVSIRGNATPTYFHNLLIEGNEVGKVRSYGIITWSTWSRRNGMTSLYPVETGIPDSEVVTWTPSTGVVIRNNYVHEVTGGGITPMHTRAALIDGNRVHKAATGRLNTKGGNVGIWWQGNDDIVIQRNEVSGTGFNGPGTDGHGFDADADNNRSLVQYNYSHDNDGGFFITVSFSGAPTKNTIVRYNLSKDDGYEVFSLSTETSGTEIYHNTVYAGGRVVVVSPPYTGAGSYPLGKIVHIYNNANGIKIRNNVFVNKTTAGYDAQNSTVYDANVYAGGPAPADMNAIKQDPQLVAPGGAAPADYKLQAGSPARGRGVSLAPGVADYFGTAAPANPDRGFHQYPAALPIATTSYAQLGNHHPFRMIDGDTATSWSSVASGVTFPGTIDVDYRQARTIGSVTLHTAFAGGQAITELDVQTWNGSAWVTQVAGAKLTWSGNNATIEQRTVTLPAPVSTQKLRLVVRKANLQWGNFALYEIS
ncbi:right-handed parallel beta-helix repeat-containing protein [Nonomuraea sp. NBC_01738]|uniref:discoidin domain-containing protein n=1 Tax=Nonomuraea sp. NBC_01738 TaxID=2976003 RepID=UPI002E0F2791|nr:right-handed parallel beta-helix repeat-containing protein [Nonomuraea sp. NBC_01738]